MRFQSNVGRTVSLFLALFLGLTACEHSIPASVPSSAEQGESLRPAVSVRSEGRLELPADASDLEPAAWATQPEGAWLVGPTGDLRLHVGFPRSTRLHLELRRPVALDSQTILVEWNGEQVGEIDASGDFETYEFDLPEELLRPGPNEVTLRASSVGRPAKAIEGFGADRDLALLLRTAQLIDSKALSTPQSEVEREDPLVERGAIAMMSTFVAEGNDLVIECSVREATEVWVGSWDVEKPERALFELLPINPEEGRLVPNLDAFEGRMVGISVTPAGNEVVRVATPTVPIRSSFPDVLWIVVDTLRADHFLGKLPELQTPAFDRLIRDGVVFESAFAHAPMTLPSHTAMFSSRYPHMSGVTNNWQPVPEGLPLLAEWLGRAGYHCEASISLGTLWTSLPQAFLKRGFDRFDGIPSIERADQANERILPLLERVSKQRPFFVFAHYSDPHEPYNSATLPERVATVDLPGLDPVTVSIATWKKLTHHVRLGAGKHSIAIDSETNLNLRELVIRDGKQRVRPVFIEGGLGEQRTRIQAEFQLGPGEHEVELLVWLHDVPDPKDIPRRYKEEVAFADREVGRLLDQLDSSGLYDSTLILFTSDHGENLGEHGAVGHARSLYEPELHVPLAIKLPVGHPGQQALADSARGLVRHIDLVPTVLAAAGLPELPGFIGVSLFEDVERLHFAETHQPESPKDLFALRDSAWKLIFSPSDEVFELYDLRDDPDELHNLYDERGDQFAHWSQLLRNYADNIEIVDRELDPDDIERLEALGYKVRSDG